MPRWRGAASAIGIGNNLLSTAQKLRKKRVRRSWGKITITRLKMYLVWCRQAFKNRHYRASRRRKEVGVFMLVSRGSESFLADEFVWHDPGRLLATLSFVETSHEGSPPRSGHPR